MANRPKIKDLGAGTIGPECMLGQKGQVAHMGPGLKLVQWTRHRPEQVLDIWTSGPLPRSRPDPGPPCCGFIVKLWERAPDNKNYPHVLVFNVLSLAPHYRYGQLGMANIAGAAFTILSPGSTALPAAGPPAQSLFQA